MRKFFVGLLSIFMILGGALLSACGATTPELKIYDSLGQEVTKTLELEINSSDPEGGYILLSAQVLNGKDGLITATAIGGYENAISVKKESMSGKKAFFKITGLTETVGSPAAIMFRATPGDLTEQVFVNVYSQVSGMEQNTDENKNNFLVEGETYSTTENGFTSDINVLTENQMIKFSPSQNSRRSLSWQIKTAGGYETIAENFKVEEKYFYDEGGQNYIYLKATDNHEKGIEATTEIKLPVLDKIAENIEFAWTSSGAITPTGDDFTDGTKSVSLISNISDDENYTGYAWVGYAGDDLVITPIVSKKTIVGKKTEYVPLSQAEIDEELAILKQGVSGDFTYFAIRTADRNNASDYKIMFSVGYEKYNYAGETKEIYLDMKEKVDSVLVSTQNQHELKGDLSDKDKPNYVELNLYDHYSTVKGISHELYGQIFDVELSPNVLEGSGLYSLKLQSPTDVEGGITSDGSCPVIVHFRQTNGIIKQLSMTSNENDWTLDGIPADGELYIFASSNLNNQTTPGFVISFISKDNGNAVTSLALTLNKSASQEDFDKLSDGAIIIDSSETEATYTKEFTLYGQSNLDGLSIEYKYASVEFSSINLIDKNVDENWVSFSITAKLKADAYGKTLNESYKIIHANGNASAEFGIQIVLPFKELTVYPDMGNNLSNSITNVVYDGTDASSLMLKNNSITPLIFSMPKTNGNSPKIDELRVEFLDQDKSGKSIEEFIAMTSEDVLEQTLSNESSVMSFNDNITSGSITTKGVGYTYLVLTFTGKDAEGNDKSIIKVVLVESYNAPEGLIITPNADGHIELYSVDSVSSEYANLTYRNISVNFENPNTTYSALENIDISSKMFGDHSKYYSVENVAVTSTGVTFTITALSTNGYNVLNDEIIVTYSIKKDAKTVYTFNTSIILTIKNAQRIESVTWINSDQDGIYYEMGATDTDASQFIILETSPNNANNKAMRVVITDDAGNNAESEKTFIYRDHSIVSDSTIALNLASSIEKGKTGYAYILPEDAVFNQNLKYYYFKDVNGNKVKFADISTLDAELDEVEISCKISEIANHYDDLISYGFFKSNASEGARNVSFENIIIKIKLEVADGSVEHPLRIYNATQFNTIKSNFHYLIMNDIVETDNVSLNRINNLAGGISGYSTDVTIKLNGDSLIDTIQAGAYVKNITLIGNVSSNGFVAQINYGTIDNVTIDTDGNRASSIVLNTEEIAGGIVGTNNGTIKNSSVLGLNIKATNAVVGGIAGENSGTITNSRVEFYNLVNGVDGTTGKNTYGVNTFTGETVGALVGTMAGGSITNTYAYDYTLSETNSVNRVLVGTTVDPFIAEYSAGSLSKVFSVVGVNSNKAAGHISNYYYSYYNATGIYESNMIVEETDKVSSTDDGFDKEINGGQSYFKDFHQEKALTMADLSVAKVQKIQDLNGNYKSVGVDDEKGVMFIYQISSDSADLSTTENDDLIALNTIKVTDLLGMNKSGSIVVSSDNTQVLKVNGSSVQVLKTGTVKLSVGVKQDASIERGITITIVNAISDLVLTRVDESGRDIEVSGKQVNIQKTKGIDITVSPKKTQVILGNLAKRYEFVAGQYTIMAHNGGEPEAVTVSEKGNPVKITAKENSVATTVTVYPQLFTDTTLQDAVTEAFKKTFTANPTDGVISFEISSDEVPLTPSTTAVVKAKIITTEMGDVIYPEITMNGATSAMRRVWTGSEYEFYDMFGNKVLAVKRDLADSSTTTSPYTYQYDMTFAVHEDYQSKVADNITFTVFFKSASGASSESFTIKLSRQEITNIDTSNFKVERTYIENSVEHYKATTRTSTLSPGNASILKVNVNPEFAYYDYAEIFYSGASVPNAVNIEAVNASNLSAGVFSALSEETAKVEYIGEKLRYIPAENSADKHNLYFKLWINTTVDRNTQIKVTVAFYRDGVAKELDFVNHFIDVKYLEEPKVKIDGEEVAYIAKGTTSQVTIEVLEDQKLDNLVLDGEKIQGVYLSAVSGPVLDKTKGINTYTATLSCDVDAKTDAKNRFYIMASVNRELNGVVESKTTYATAVVVDFRIDDIEIVGASEGNLIVWQNVSKQFNAEYSLVPDDSQYTITSENQTTVNQLKQAKKSFVNNHYYPKDQPTGTDDQSEYYINWIKPEGVWEKQTLLDRLYVRTTNGDKPYNDESLDLPFEFIEDSGLVKVRGLRSNASAVTMVLYTYIYAGGIQSVIETEFTVTVETFSDPDLPLSIKSADDFLALDPSKVEQGTTIIPQDYILENDIVLENYIPFNTSAIRSLDGNGYTIYIKSFDLETTSTLNLALFNTVTTLTQSEQNSASETTLKNVRVNYYNGGQLIIDVSRHKEINIAGIAITNEGVITNCEVVSFYETNLAGESLTSDVTSACTIHTKTKGFNVAYRNGANTSEDVFLADNSNWTSQIAGFVVTNNGSITNSRVGGDDIYLIKEASANDESATSEIKTLDQFNIVGQGDIAGFVLYNNGAVASSFVKNIDISNHSSATKFITTGFVGTNAEYGRILTSYIEGVKSPLGDAKAELYANLGSTITSDTGYIAGFIYENKGSIKNSYSNIMIANSSEVQKVYLASGFVYMNSGNIENSYSASQVENANYSQMNFSGVDKDGRLLKAGEYINCYYFSVDMYVEEVSDAIDNTTETQYKTGATLIKNPEISSSFYGFAVAENKTETHKDGIWIMDEIYGIKLIEPDYIAHSHRYKEILDEETTDGYYQTQEIDGKTIKYYLPYGILFVNTNEYKNTTLGGDNNPILIADAQDWQDVCGESESSYIKEYYLNGNISGVYRIVKDIDLSTLNKDVQSSKTNFTGALYGNGFTLSGIALSQTGEETANSNTTKFGLFASITTTTTGGRKNSPALVANINLDIAQVTAGNVPAVGGLAGMIRNATIVNIDVSFDEDSIVEGLHYVGGLVGFAYNDNKIKNITISNPNILADTYTEDDDQPNYINEVSSFRNEIKTNIENLLATTSKNYSYAGAAIGLIENYLETNQGSTKFENVNEVDTVYDVNNIRVDGSINVKGQVVGGVFGFVGVHTDVNDIGLTVDTTSDTKSKIISTRYFAGGVVGQSYGRLSRIFAQHDATLQNAIEDNMELFYKGNTAVERGVLDLFDTTQTDMENTQIAVGGLIGYVGNGYLSISYSKLNVTSMSSTYAGGIIGYIDVAGVDAYTVVLSTMYGSEEKGAAAKYFINEVYATGDVRANTMAGGLIGAIEGQDSQVKLLAVNALNYFTTYNYITGEYETLADGQYEISSNYHINSFVGQFIDEEGEVEEFAVRNATDEDLEEKTDGQSWKNSASEYKIRFKDEDGVKNYDVNSYISFVKGVESYATDGTGSASGMEEPLASVARYDSYKFANQTVYLKRFGEPMLTTKVEGKESYTYNKKLEALIDFNEDMAKDADEYMLNIYSIASAHQYSNSSVGHTMTQSGFINSGIWISSNWDHPIDDLFPSIKLKEVYDVVYLDVYNANEVFNQMVYNPNLVVIVRGLKTPDSNLEDPDSYTDIHIYQSADTPTKFTVMDSNFDQIAAFDKLGSIQAYAGKIVGGKYPIGADEEDEYVKIISHAGNFIANVEEGFAVQNQTFVYEKIEEYNNVDETKKEPVPDLYPDENPNPIEVKNALFVDGQMRGVKLVGLRILLNAPVKATEDEETFNYGLVASKISSSTITGLKIDASGMSSSDTILQIAPNIDGSRTDIELNVGLVAGVLSQESEESIMVVKGLNILTLDGQPLINTSDIPEGKINNSHIGGYFGYIPNEEKGTAGFKVMLAGFGSNTVKMQIGHKSTLNANAKQHMYIGGFAGYVTGLKNFISAENDSLEYHIKYSLPENVNDLRLGNVVGCLMTNSAMDIIGDTKANSNNAGAITQVITSETNANWAYIGGIVGYHDTAPLTIKGFGKVKLATINPIGLVSTDDSVKGGEDGNGASSTKELCYGGIVGMSRAKLTIESENNQVNITNESTAVKLKQNTDNGQIKAGSIVGASTASTVDGESLDISGTDGNSGQYTSDVDFELTGKNIIFGGIVGSLYNSDTSVEVAQKVNIVGHSEKAIAYNGDVKYTSGTTVTATRMTSNPQSILGGIVGSIENANSASKSDLTTQNTSHGGSFTIEDSQDAIITTGGTVANVGVKNQNNNITLENGYNYGNTFVAYDDDFTDLTEYNYGGITGMLSKAIYNISGNYVANSSHNSRYLTSRNTAHALFGNGQPTGTIENNYYSHAVCLLTDDLGKDIAYNTAYSSETNRNGYNRGYASYFDDSESDIINKILGGIEEGTLESGHKLKPIEFNDNFASVQANGSDLGTNDGKFQGLTYYAVTKDTTVTNKTFKMTNTAFIGDGFKITFTNTNTLVQSLFVFMKNYSFVSSLVEDVNMDFENNAAQNQRYAGLVINGTWEDPNVSYQESRNTQIYAVNAYGTIDICRNDVLSIAGLVHSTDGKIADCSTDIDIVDRGSGSSVFTFARVYEDSIIENSFSLGSTTTYSGGKLYAFANTDNTVGTIEDNYSATRIDWNNYIDLDATATLGANILFNKDGLKYDLDALGLGDVNSVLTDDIKTFKYGDNLGDLWESTDEFNYGYPILKYQYLKMSSYATQGEVEYDCGHDDCDHSTYDCYVENYSYTRVKNGTNAENSNFYMVPNAGVLSNQVKKATSGNFALKYDINLKKTSSYTEGKLGLNDTKFSGNLDGQGHTISGLSTSLFNQVNGGYVKNLRLTEVTGSSPALADKISSATVSNVTISGESTALGGLANSIDSANIYAVQSTMNLIPEISDRYNYNDVGGIVGYVWGYNNIIKYCSNYGNITVTNSSGTASSYVGGIVGGIYGSDITITHCSNAGAILNNIEVKDLTDGTLVTAGILGTGSNLKVIIDRCYNTGIIKSGHKQLNNVVDKDGKILNDVQKSYAAGIVAQGMENHNSSITNCYNEGTVEALGANGTFEVVETIGNVYIQWHYGSDGWKYGYDDSKENSIIETSVTKTKFESEYEIKGEFEGEHGQLCKYVYEETGEQGYVYIIQTSPQNVMAYGIGPGNGENNYSKFVKADAYGAYSVFANGSGLEKGEVLLKILLDEFEAVDYGYDFSEEGDNAFTANAKEYVNMPEDICESMKKTGLLDEKGNVQDDELESEMEKWWDNLSEKDKGKYGSFEKFYSYYTNDTFVSTTRFRSEITLKYSRFGEVKMPNDADKRIASTNLLGIPTAIALMQDYILQMDLGVYGGMPNAYYKKFGFETYYTKITETFVYGLNTNAQYTSRDPNYGDWTSYADLNVTNVLDFYNAKLFAKDTCEKIYDTSEQDFEGLKTLVDSTTSQQKPADKILQIANQTFYISENNTECFTGKVGTQTITYDCSSLMIDNRGKDDDNYSCKFESITCESESLPYTQSWDGDKKELTATVYYTERFGGKQISASIVANYNQTGVIDTSNANFYVTDNGNIGLGLNFDDTQKRAIETTIDLWETFTILSTNGPSYRAYKLTNASDSSKEIYFQYNKELNDFVYIPEINNLSLNDITYASDQEWKLTYQEAAVEDMLFTSGGSLSTTIDSPETQSIYSSKGTGELDGYLPVLDMHTKDIFVFDKDGNVLAYQPFGTFGWQIEKNLDESVYVTHAYVKDITLTTEYQLQAVYSEENTKIVGTVGTNGLVIWNKGEGSENYATYNLLDNQNKVIHKDVSLYDRKYIAGASYYVYNTGLSVPDDVTKTQDITISDCGTYQIEVTYSANATPLFTDTVPKFKDWNTNTEDTQAEHNIEVANISWVMKDYTITKTSNSDDFDMIGVFDLSIAGTKVADQQYSANSTYSVSLADIDVTGTSQTVNLTVYQTHAFGENELDKYNIYYSNSSETYHGGYSKASANNSVLVHKDYFGSDVLIAGQSYLITDADQNRVASFVYQGEDYIGLEIDKNISGGNLYHVFDLTYYIDEETGEEYWHDSGLSNSLNDIILYAATGSDDVTKIDGSYRYDGTGLTDSEGNRITKQYITGKVTGFNTNELTAQILVKKDINIAQPVVVESKTLESGSISISTKDYIYINDNSYIVDDAETKVETGVVTKVNEYTIENTPVSIEDINIGKDNYQILIENGELPSSWECTYLDGKLSIVAHAKLTSSLTQLVKGGWYSGNLSEGHEYTFTLYYEDVNTKEITTETITAEYSSGIFADKGSESNPLVRVVCNVVAFKITSDSTNSETYTLDTLTSFKPLPIILTSDILLGYLNATAEMKVNVIGNDYNISFCGVRLMKSTTATIKGVNLLGQVGLFADTTPRFFIDSGTAIDVNLYGSYNIRQSHTSNSNTLLSYTNYVITSAEGSDLSGICSYISIDACSDVGASVSLFTTNEQTEIRQIATCFAARGRDAYIYKDTERRSLSDRDYIMVPSIDAYDGTAAGSFKAGDDDLIKNIRSGEAGAKRCMINVSPIEGWHEETTPGDGEETNWEICSTNINEFTRYKDENETAEQYCERQRILYETKENGEIVIAGARCRNGFKIRSVEDSVYYGQTKDSKYSTLGNIYTASHITPNYYPYEYNGDNKEVDCLWTKTSWFHGGSSEDSDTFVRDLMTDVLGYGARYNGQFTCRDQLTPTLN